MKNIILKKQLRTAGATRQEARDLSAIINDLRDSVPHLNASVKRQIAQQIGLKPKPIYTKPRFALAGAFVALIILSIAAQFAQPGSPLYALKHATEEVRVILQPSFKNELQHRRQDEQRKIDEQQKIEDTRSNGSDANPSSGSSSDGTPINVNDSGSGKIEDIKVDALGSGSPEVRTPEVKVDSSGKSIETNSSGGSNDRTSVDGFRL